MIRLVGSARKHGLRFFVVDIFGHPRSRKLTRQAKLYGDQMADIAIPFSLLASSLDKQHAQQQAARFCDVATKQIKDNYPCTPLQQRLLILTTNDVKSALHAACSNYHLP